MCFIALSDGMPRTDNAAFHPVMKGAILFLGMAPENGTYSGRTPNFSVFSGKAHILVIHIEITKVSSSKFSK